MADKTTDIKAKELTKIPFSITNKLEKEIETFQSIIDKLTKSTIISELQDKIQITFEEILKKTVDPIIAHIKGNALESLGYCDAANMFKAKAIELGYIVESLSSAQLYNKLITKYNLSTVLQNNLFSAVNDYDNGNIDNETMSTVVGAISAIVSDTTENIDKLINENKINENLDNIQYPLTWVNGNICDYGGHILAKMYRENDSILSPADRDQFGQQLMQGFNTTMGFPNTVVHFDSPENANESVKQEMGYSPNEDRNWAFFRNSDVEIEKPEFDSVSLKNLINDDAFLKFSYHNLATGDEDKDLEMIYKNYIKGDENLMNKLKEYDRFTTKIQENAITKDAVATSIINTLKQFDINVGTTDSAQDINTNIIAKITDLLKVQMPGVKEAYLLDILHSKDVKEELINTFKVLTIKDVVDKIKHSNIMITDVQSHEHTESSLIEKIKKSFNISDGSADFVAFTFTMSLHIALSVAYIGIVPASTVMAICVGILILSAMGLSYE